MPKWLADDLKKARDCAIYAQEQIDDAGLIKMLTSIKEQLHAKGEAQQDQQPQVADRYKVRERDVERLIEDITEHRDEYIRYLADVGKLSPDLSV